MWHNGRPTVALVFLFSAAPFGVQLGAWHAMDLLYTFDGPATTGLATEEKPRRPESLLDSWAQLASTG